MTAGSVHAMSPQEVVERALAASKADGQVAFVVESSEANLRWASNSLTTNGAMRSRQVVVVSFVDGGAGMAAGTVTRSGTPDIGELVAASEQAARDAGPAEDAVPLIGDLPSVGGDWTAAPAETSIEVFADFAPRRSVRRATAVNCSSASPSTRWPRRTSAARPGSGCGTTSPRGGWS
jgi:predicted Zn-dependent protease